jgi:hypothetical protein
MAAFLMISMMAECVHIAFFYERAQSIYQRLVREEYFSHVQPVD